MSDILIRGMEMPKSCNSCMFDVYGLCLINSNLERKDELTHSCPLIPVPDHGRLGDLDKLEDYFKAYKWDKAADIVCFAPTIIPADKDGAE